MTATAERTTERLPAAAEKRTSAPSARWRSFLPRSSPWHHPWALEGFTWLYVVWSIVPIGIAALFSFNNGKSQSAWQGFSMQWYITDPLHSAVIQTLRLAGLTTVITVPLGLGFAIGIDRWRGRTPSTLNLVMVFSFV